MKKFITIGLVGICALSAACGPLEEGGEAPVESSEQAVVVVSPDDVAMHCTPKQSGYGTFNVWFDKSGGKFTQASWLNNGPKAAVLRLFIGDNTGKQGIQVPAHGRGTWNFVNVSGPVKLWFEAKYGTTAFGWSIYCSEKLDNAKST